VRRNNFIDIILLCTKLSRNNSFSSQVHPLV